MIGQIDRVSLNGTVDGWCLDEKAPENKAHLAVCVDGVEVGRAIACLYRGDLKEAGLFDGCFAFSVQIPDKFMRHSESLSITMFDLITEEQVGHAFIAKLQENLSVSDNVNDTSQTERNIASDVNTSSFITQGKANVTGYVDYIGQRQLLQGWAWREHRPKQRIYVSVRLDGMEIGRTLACDYRGDLENGELRDGYQGYSLHIPLSLISTDAEQNIEVVEVETGLLIGTSSLVHKGSYTISQSEYSDKDLEDASYLFDEQFYTTQDPNLSGTRNELLQHFLTEGWKKGFDPSTSFCTNFYLSSNQEIAKAKINPLLHYVRHGQREKRSPVPYTILRQATYQPLVSIIVPNYNHARFLTERLTSIDNQTYSNVEIILLDDCSSDDSQHVLDNFVSRNDSVVKRVYNNFNSGNPFSQWYRGINIAAGELVWICESDDACKPDALEKLVRHFSDRAVMIAFGRTQFIDIESRVVPGLDEYRERAEPGIWAHIVKRYAKQWFNNAFGRRNVIANVGGCLMRNVDLDRQVWDDVKTFKICGDWLIYINIAAGGKIVYDPDVITYFRQHQSNTSASNFDKIFFYEEHARILQSLEQAWTIPEHTKNLFLENINHMWNHFGMQIKYGGMLKAVPRFTTRVRTQREHIIIGSLGFMLGGGEIFPLNLANELVNAGYRVSLLCANLVDVNEEIVARLNPRIPILDGSEAKMKGADVFLDLVGATIVHTHVVNIDDILLNTIKNAFHFPYVVTLHGSHQGKELQIDKLLLMMLKRVNQWVYLTDKNLDPFRGIPLDRAFFSKIPNAVSYDPRPFPSTRQQLGIDDDTIVFTLAARGIQQKGWRASIEALKLMRKRHPHAKVHLLMAGAGPKTDEVRSANEEGLPITFLGFQSCINGLYRISDCALLPTRFEGESFPLSIIQALQEGIPVIATSTGEIPSMICLGAQTAGVLIENVRNSPSFFDLVYQAMLEMTDPDRRSRAAQVANRLKTAFDMDVIVKKYLRLYDLALDDSKYFSNAE